ncbi:MAG: hypothetical protein AAF725_08695 [Acidobacteriota bacterium]
MAKRLTLLFIASLLLAGGAGAQTVIQVTSASQLTTLLGTGGGSAADGTVLELAAGTYGAPNDGFLISNPDRSLTLRSAVPGAVFLDGLGSRPILRYNVTDSSRRGTVVFEGLTFRRGFSTSNSRASAVTLRDADATFIDCVFEDNVNESAGNGLGTVGLRLGATGLFLRSILRDNTSQTSGAGAAVVSGSTLWCHECQFLRNRNNVAGHIPTATGAGLVASDSSEIYLSNSRFEANEAGFAGGAFDVKGDYGENPVLLTASNSTFEDNLAEPHPSVNTPSPAAGGVGNIEDNTIAKFYSSRFFDNHARFGGALSNYRGQVEIFDSVFRGNYAIGQPSTNTTARGGALFGISDDTTFDGANNRPTSRILIRDSLFDGAVAPGAPQSVAAHTGGCIFSTGDVFRQLGLGGVTPGGSLAQNRARLDIARTAFVGCDVDDIDFPSAFGGGIFSSLSLVTLDDSLFINNDATGTNSSGGAVALTRFVDVTVRNTTFQNNSAAVRGGAMFMVGATIDIDGNVFAKNSVGGASVGTSLGAALFVGVQDDSSRGIEGTVRNSLFVENEGLAIYDDDRVDTTGYFSTVTFLNNEFAGNFFAPSVYRDVIVGPSGIVDPAGLNALVVDRGNGNTTDKAPANDNVALPSAPATGQLLAAPPQILDRAAAGDAGQGTEAFVAYAWCGECAELDGGQLGLNTGLAPSGTGVRTLMVFNNGACSGAPAVDTTAFVTQGADPEATLAANPLMITSGGTSTLSWQTPSGAFLDSALNRGSGLVSTASGTAQVSPALTTEYTFFALTEEGGAVAQETVFVDEDPPNNDLIFQDDFESGTTSSWD